MLRLRFKATVVVSLFLVFGFIATTGKAKMLEGIVSNLFAPASNATGKSATQPKLPFLKAGNSISAPVQAATTIAPTGDAGLGFDIEGNLEANSPNADTSDWVSGATGKGAAMFAGGATLDANKTFRRTDGFNNLNDNVFKSGFKANDNPNSWGWAFQKASTNDDINNAMLHLSTDKSENLWLMMGVDRLGTAADSYLDFELLQNTLTVNSNGTFNSGGQQGGRTVGDLLLTMKLPAGGGKPQLFIQRWQNDGAGFNWFDLTLPSDGLVFVAANGSATVAPFTAFGGPNYAANQFGEAALNLTPLLASLQKVSSCLAFKTVLIKSKSSAAANATVLDFLEPIQATFGTAPTVAVNSETICSGGTATLTASVAGGKSPFTFVWSGPNNFAAKTSSISVSTPGTYTVTVQDTNGCFSQSALGTVTITSAATVDAGADITTCAATPSVILGGLVGGGATGGTWSGGKGTFTPDANTLNATYTPTAAEIAAGSVVLKLTTTGPCVAVSDSVNIIVGATASARAGADQTVCANNPAVKLSGAVGGATGGVWTTNGTGTFSPNATTLNAIYTPSPADLTSKSLTLTLTTTGSSCGTGSDQMSILVSPVPTVNAGADREACLSNPSVVLAGQIGGSAAIGTWSGGAGTFTPNANTLNATYTPTATEIAAGLVTLTLTTNNPVGPCGAVSDQMVITFSGAATVNAGLDQTLCAASPVASLAGVIGGTAASATWSGGAGVFSPNANSLNVTYTPTAGEIALGGVTLTLSTNDPVGACGAVSDQVKINFLTAPTANAGADFTVCATSPSVGLTGAIGNGASSASWVGGTGSFLPNRTTLNATYTPSASEIAAGSVTLTLTTNDPAGPCGSASDQMVITINPAATANAGLDQTACASSPTVKLAGAFGGSASSASWVGGAGTFTPNRNTLNANYTPTAGEVSAGSVTLTLTTNDPAGICGAVSDQMKISFSAAPSTTVTAPAAVCANSTGNVASVSSAGVGAGYNWTLTNGTITAGQGTNQIVWTAGSSGAVTIGVTVTAGGACSATGSKQTSITTSATASAGADQALCQTVQGTVGFNLVGSVSGGAPSWSVVGSTGSAAAAIVSPSTASTAVNVTGAGTVTLRLSVAGTNGCGSAFDDVVLTTNALPTANAGVDQTVCQTSGAVTFSLSGVASNGLPAAQAWTVVSSTGNTQTSLIGQNAANTSVSVSGVGSVTMRFNVNSTGGCGTAADDVVLTVKTAVSATITAAASVCANSANNTASVPDAGTGAGYNWTISNGTITGGQTSRTVTWTAGGSGSTTLSVTVSAPAQNGSAGCNAANSLNVALTESPLANAGADKTACRTSDPTVVTVNGSASGGTPQWSVVGSTGTALANIVSPTAATTNVNVNGTGTVTLRLTVNSQSCGSVSDDLVLTVNTCSPPVGPGLPLLAESDISDSKAGSVLIYNIYTSNPTVPAVQNTRINITNVNPGLDIAVHLFFIDGDSCSVADSYLCLSRNQTSSFHTADFDPGTTGFIIAVAVNSITGCPTNFNYLIGDEYVKFASGHTANLTAEAISAISSSAMLCDETSPIATLNFDGIAYNRLPRTLALDDIPSRADGNDTMLIVNRIGGNLGIGTASLGTLFGIVYNDTENSSSFNLTGSCQLRGSLSSNFPRTVPRLDQFIPAGKSGWMRLYGFGADGNKGLSGAVINFNPNAATSALAYNHGRNLHKLSLDTTNSLVIPVFPPPCQ